MDEIRPLPANYSLLWLKLAFKLLKKNYGVCLLVFLVTLGFSFLVEIILPSVATIVNPLMTTIFGLAYLEMGRQMVKDEDVKLQTILGLFKNSEKLRQLMPFLIFITLSSVLQHGLDFFLTPILGLGTVFILSLLLSIIFFLVFGFSLPLMYFKNLGLKETIHWNLHYILANIKVFMLFSVLCFVALVASTLLLLAPLFFIFGPLLVPLYYIVYISVFDNFEPDRLLGRQLVVQTI